MSVDKMIKDQERDQSRERERQSAYQLSEAKAYGNKLPKARAFCARPQKQHFFTSFVVGKQKLLRK